MDEKCLIVICATRIMYFNTYAIKLKYMYLHQFYIGRIQGSGVWLNIGLVEEATDGACVIYNLNPNCSHRTSVVGFVLKTGSQRSIIDTTLESLSAT